ncbi:MAG TPA: hypothetical protein VGH77_02635 [Streptosporangiaceae bacterium]
MADRRLPGTGTGLTGTGRTGTGWTGARLASTGPFSAGLASTGRTGTGWTGARLASAGLAGPGRATRPGAARHPPGQFGGVRPSGRRLG